VLELKVVGGSVGGNNGTGGTFLCWRGKEGVLIVNDVEVDDEFSKAVVMDEVGVGDFSGSRFDCKRKCRSVGVMKRRKEGRRLPEKEKKHDVNGDDLDEVPATFEVMHREKKKAVPLFLWIVVPLWFVGVVVVYRILGSRRIARLWARVFGRKGRHAL
jgi:hypothetical protein